MLPIPSAVPYELTAEDFAALLRWFHVNESEVAEASRRIADELLDVPDVEDLVPDRPLLSVAQRERIAERMTRIATGTQDAIKAVVKKGIEESLTRQEIADRIRGKVEETYRGRAETIARTELAIADQEAAHERYAEYGLSHVHIFDGPDCGWTSHDDPDKANGSVRTLEDAQAHPLAHPNCRRASAPYIPE